MTVKDYPCVNIKRNKRGRGFGDIITAVKNVLPSSDSNARYQYPGEKHAILKLGNGKFGTANYSGQLGPQ